MNYDELQKRIAAMGLPVSTLTRRQKRDFPARRITYKGHPLLVRATVRHNDECGNGHNTFSVTGEYTEPGTSWERGGGGCCHDEIASAFPELAPFIRWHLMSTDGPMHYVANTVFLAGDRDCWGTRKGDPRQWSKVVSFEGIPFTFRFEKEFTEWLELTANGAKSADFLPVEVLHPRDPKTYGSNWTLKGFPADWYKCPFKNGADAREFSEALHRFRLMVEKVPTSWGEGKERELDKARHAAIWPDATDEELTAPGLEERLLARLPGLIAQFKKDVESLGFVY